MLPSRRIPIATLATAFLVGTLPQGAWAQARGGAVALDQSLAGITSTARVLLIAAHPDDEDTQALAWLTRGKHVETAYLSLTRGDGGQNLIGPELGDALGAIRTEELLAARRVDGGRQYFTRAYDFGFSKNAEETAKHWPRDSILGDVVTVIRAFRPHVIYSIWSGTRADGHGHHEYAGQMAREAFDAAGDTVRFPVAKFGPAWTPLKFYRRGAGGLDLPVNDYDPVLGKTFAAIAAESRSQHRSQGFGGIALGSIVPGAGGRGFFGAIRLEASRVGAADPKADAGIFAGIDTSFARLVAEAPAPAQALLRTVGARADSANAMLDLARPWTVLPLVARMAGTLREARTVVPECRLRTMRRATETIGHPCAQADLDLDAAIALLERRAGRAVLAAAEIEVDPTAPRELMAFGDSLPVTVAIVNHGRAPVTVSNLRITGGPRDGFQDVTLAPDSGVTLTQTVIGYPDLRPWWLAGAHAEGLLPARRSPADGVARVSATSEDLVPAVAVSEETRRMSDVWVTFEVDGQSLPVNVGPLIHREADPVLGVQDQPLGGVPPVTIAFDGILEYVPAIQPIDRYMRMTLRSYADAPRTFALQLVSPEGLRVDSLPPSVTLKAGEQREIYLRVRGSLKPGRYEFGVIGQYADGSKFGEGFFAVNYPHIRPINIYRSSALYVEAVDVAVPSRLTVAYVQGVGDNTAGFLRQLGIPVTVIQPAEIANWDLSRFSTVVVGTRAFDASGALAAFAPRLMDFARNGGTLVVQYGQHMDAVPGAFPFPLAWQNPAERVTVEDAPVTVLDSASKLLRFPNALGKDDWGDWVQERALYMPSTIDRRYGTPLEMHDPGEKENRGAILTAPVGKGMYVFTSLSLFRQVPNGVPGSVRLWVNLLSAGMAPASRPTP
ncbi:MAG TPA: PIG-L family deacetylase [Gemmatimonadaceae bacterium]|nr:PIG-L family deacetylase [Gemmatimonadaceae bacterium]